FRAQPIADPGAILRMRDCFGELSVHRGYFVRGTRQEAPVDEAQTARELALHGSDRDVQIVESAQSAQPNRAPLRRIPPDVIEIGKAFGVTQVPEQGEPVAP